MQVEAQPENTDSILSQQLGEKRGLYLLLVFTRC